MKRYFIQTVTLLVVIPALFLGGCGEDLTRDKHFKGNSAVTLYRLNSHNQRALMITGKPFMIVKFLKIDSQTATDCYFGLSDVAESDIAGVESIPHDTFLRPSDIESNQSFNFSADSPIILPVDWNNKRTTDNRDTRFSFEYYPSGHSDKRIEKWEFIFENKEIDNAAFVSGSVSNIDPDNFKGIDSGSNTFRLESL